ncbi:hypothetical protein BD769DRAFT_1666927 [Suillus cothurnatus]|nr:hypothetical protein BD769DRAFT_1666927 [Suillus cothurnatus]
MAQQWIFQVRACIKAGEVTRLQIPPIKSGSVLPDQYRQVTILRTFSSVSSSLPINQARCQALDGSCSSSLLVGSGDDAGVDLDSSDQMPDSRQHSVQPFRPTHPHLQGLSFPRKQRKIRDVHDRWFYFESRGLEPLESPPQLTEAKPGDIFFHRIDGLNKCQIWMSEILRQSSEGHANGVEELIIVWVAVTEGHQVIKADGSLRYVVVTEGLQPSLVAESTYDKLYRRRISDAPLCFGGSVGNTPAVYEYFSGSLMVEHDEVDQIIDDHVLQIKSARPPSSKSPFREAINGPSTSEN